jgi:hypothetical protein
MSSMGPLALAEALDPSPLDMRHVQGRANREMQMFRMTFLLVFVLAAAMPGRLADAGSIDRAKNAPEAACRKIVDRYRAIVGADAEAPYRKGEYAASPLDVLAETKSSGVTIEPDKVLENFDKDPRQAIKDWAKSQKPPIAVSKDVEDELAQLATTGVTARIVQLPGTQVYRVSTIEGTASCFASKYFLVKGGHAQLARGPEAWSEENGAGCGIIREFGKIDDIPVAFEDNYEEGGAALSADLTVQGWSGEAFAPPCSIHFEFAPRLLPKATYNHWDESCTVANCVALREAAFGLIEAAQTFSGQAQKQLVDQLSPSQRTDFTAMQKIANADDAAADVGQPDTTDRSLLLLPLLIDNSLYLARAGHFRIGWRVFSDWGVVIERRDRNTMVEVARIAVGATKGKVTKADVK